MTRREILIAIVAFAIGEDEGRRFRPSPPLATRAPGVGDSDAFFAKLANGSPQRGRPFYFPPLTLPAREVRR